MAEPVIQQDIDVSLFIGNHVSEEFPCFKFVEGSDPMVVMYGNLVQGDIPLVFDNGSTRKVFPKRISGSAYNIQKLLRVLDKLYYYNERGECFEIRDTVDYLEAVLQ